MKCCCLRLGFARRLTALAVSIAVILSAQALSISSLAKSVNKSGDLNSNQASPSRNELQLTAASATVTSTGVLLRWRTNSMPDNLGFNIYRLKDGQRTRVNREIIPGELFGPRPSALTRGGYSYSWFDRGGAADATYFIESVSVDGATKMHEPLTPVISKAASEFEQTAEGLNGGGTNAIASADTFERYYPAEEAQEPRTPSGTIQEQWAIAGQAALKIAIRKDGWYRVTQPQMVAAGFNPAVDIRNLRLFVDANEVAISTSQRTGQFGSGDYIEFYGRGLDVPTSDTRIYYLIAGTTPGKRVHGDNQLDGDPPAPTPTPTPASPLVLPPSNVAVLRDPIFFSWVGSDISVLAQSLERSNAPISEPSKASNASLPGAAQPGNARIDNASLDNSQPETAPTAGSSEVKQEPEQTAKDDRHRRDEVTPIAGSASAVATKNAPKPVNLQSFARAGNSAALTTSRRQLRNRRFSKKRKRNKPRRQSRSDRNHAVFSDGFAPANFNQTIQIKERFVYLSNLLNGDEENFFGRVISSSPVTQTLMVSNPDLTAAGSATLEFALQGVMSQLGNSHQVSVAFNGITIGSVNFGPLDHPVRTFSIPIAQLQSGNNNLTFTKTSTGEVCIVDYVRLTYPHAFKADADSLRFNLRGSQTLKVDGFSTPSVRLIDYTDPFDVGITRPASEPSALGNAITVPLSEKRSKEQRLLYAIPEGQFDQPAALSLNQPSTLNLNSNAADFLIVSHRTFIPSFSANVSPINTSLVAQRQSQGMITAVVDVDDVYDEFSYGVHGPQALKSFLQHAATHWATPPRYIIFAGDASLDPRNYQGVGDFDLVPTKLVDATFNETASDDWLADFDNDGIANIPIGRLPLRTAAEATLVISKIVNYTPANVPQAALLIADDPGTPPIWDFETANDDVQALLPPTMTVQRVNVRTEPSPAQATADIINGLIQGRSVVNYSGHGNVDVWSGASIFTSANATALTNGNKLPFVIVMDCLNGYYHDPTLLSLSEAFLKAANGGAVAAFASSGLTTTFGQRQMELQLYATLYGSQPIALGDAIKIAKGATTDIDVRTTWIFFGDPSIKIR